MVAPDGSVYMQVESSQSALAASATDCSSDVNTIQSYTESLQVVHLVSGSSAQFQTLGTHSKSDWISAATPPYYAILRMHRAISFPMVKAAS